jgi:hypothetical protein
MWQCVAKRWIHVADMWLYVATMWISVAKKWRWHFFSFNVAKKWLSVANMWIITCIFVKKSAIATYLLHLRVKCHISATLLYRYLSGILRKARFFYLSFI